MMVKTLRRVMVGGLLVLSLVLGNLMVIPAADAHSDEVGVTDNAAYGQQASQGGKRAKQLARARRATAKYQDISVALADGYIKASECVGTPNGAMGFHFVKDSLAQDLIILAGQPEALVYWKDERGGYKLVAVEYIVADVGQPRPVLFERSFDGPDQIAGPGTPMLYTLHAWLFEHNPDGINAPFNPRLRCPEQPGGHH